MIPFCCMVYTQDYSQYYQGQQPSNSCTYLMEIGLSQDQGHGDYSQNPYSSTHYSYPDNSMNQQNQNAGVAPSGEAQLGMLLFRIDRILNMV